MFYHLLSVVIIHSAPFCKLIDLLSILSIISLRICDCIIITSSVNWLYLCRCLSFGFSADPFACKCVYICKYECTCVIRYTCMYVCIFVYVYACKCVLLVVSYMNTFNIRFFSFPTPSRVQVLSGH